MLRGYGNRIRLVNPLRKIFSTRDQSDSVIYGRALNGRGPGSGHVAEAVASIRANVPDVTTKLLAAMRADLINDWCDDPDNLLYAVFCHHGEKYTTEALAHRVTDGDEERYARGFVSSFWS